MMNDYKTIDDKKTELFLEPIPRWITSYGFVTMFVLAFAIVSFSYLFKVPRTLSVSVHFEKEKAHMVLTFEQVSYVHNGNTIHINTPFQKTPIVAVVNKAGMWAEGNKVIIPVTINQSILNEMAFKNYLDCPGEILIEKTSLFSKVFRKDNSLNP